MFCSSVNAKGIDRLECSAPWPGIKARLDLVYNTKSLVIQASEALQLPQLDSPGAEPETTLLPFSVYDVQLQSPYRYLYVIHFGIHSVFRKPFFAYHARSNMR